MKSILRSTTDPAVSKREIKHRALTRAAAAEGIVLLKNNGALPLNNKTIALYGAGARKTIAGGTGSGEVHGRKGFGTNIEQGLLQAGYTITGTQWLDDFDAEYKRCYDAWYKMVTDKIRFVTPFKMFDILSTHQFRFPVGRAVNLHDIETSATDTAIYVLARQAGEGQDRKTEPGDYLLAPSEIESLRLMAQQYAHVILVINVGGMIDLSVLDDIPNIGAVVYLVQAGQDGGAALADVLSGKVSPCGKLTDTWARQYSDYPNAENFSYRNGNLKEEHYTEGICVGYRYFDSFQKEVRYPFGYGLSYTDFSLNVVSVEKQNTSVCIKIDVQNTGKASGKEVAQVYVCAPSGQLQREYQQLAAFGKTQVLAPGQTQTLALTFDVQDLAGYHAQSAAWLLEAGDYVLRVGNSSRNTVPAATLCVEDEIITEKVQNICPPREEFVDWAIPRRADENGAGLPVLAFAADEFITQTVTYAAPPVKSSGKLSKLLAPLSTKEKLRLCVGGSFVEKMVNLAPGACGHTTMALWNKYHIPNVQFADGPAGLNLMARVGITKNGAQKTLDIPEQYNFGILRWLLLFVMAKESKVEAHYQYCTAWPVQTLLAQTWDTSLLEQIGHAVGEEMTEMGVTLWLAPGMNIHRNPLCGRNFEYYSEDPFLTGKMAAALTRGVQSHSGIGVTVKHFACNNQEDNRTGVSAEISERALREVYLKGFSIAVRESRPKAVMTSYNLVNGVYTGNSYDLCTKVLRNEWGFDGLVMTDWNGIDLKHGDVPTCLASGNDLIMPGSKAIYKALVSAAKSGTLKQEDIDRCAANVLSLIVRSAVLHDN